MLSDRIAYALKEILKRLDGSGINWVLAGSVSLALQGVDVIPNDIDILTDERGAYTISGILKEYEVELIRWSESSEFRSYFAKYVIQGIGVDVIGDLEERAGGEWKDFSGRLGSKIIVDFKGVSLPVSPLKEHLESYMRSEREKDRAKVRDILMVENI